MNNLDTIAYWLGYSFLIVFSIVVGIGGLAAAITYYANRIYRSLIMTYDLYVLGFWLKEIKKHGRRVPTKAAVKKYVDETKDDL